MLIKIAEELQRISASIDFIDQEQAVAAIEAAMGAARHLLEAMTVEVFHLTTEKKTYGSAEEVTVFKRFAKDLSEKFQASQEKSAQHFDTYNLEIIKGPWTYAYQEQRDVWIEDNDGYKKLRELANKANIKNPIPQEHLEFYKDTRAVIAIPLYHRIGVSNQLIGLISFEFFSPKSYNAELHDALNAIAKPVADVIWKGNTWNHSKSGTKEVVEKFAQLCNVLRNDSLLFKTGLFAPNTPELDDIRVLCQESFSHDKIEMDSYDGISNLTELSIRYPGQDIIAIIRKEHFAIFDITSYNPIIVFFLGIMFAEHKPCMILANQDSVKELPSVIAGLAAAAGQNTSGLLHLYSYQKQDGVRFIDFHGASTEWKTIWEDFLSNVKKLSPTFVTASDWGASKS